jgi:hypothetical protein
VTGNLPILVYSIIIVLLAGFIRGYSGFGASMIIVIGLSLVYRVVEIVPVILLLEIIASSYLLPRVLKDVNWSSLRTLLIGVVVGTPAGVYLLSTVSDRIMRSAVSLLIILLIPLLWKGFQLKQMPGRNMTLLTGAVSGLVNGSAAIGGPPVVLFYFSSPQGASISRASLIAFFLATDLIATGLCIWNRLVTLQTIQLTGLFVIPLVIGLTAGARFFFKTDPDLFRKRVLAFLLIMAITTFTRSILP